jgi:acetolactate synthase-1/2/3 large subunit
MDPRMTRRSMLKATAAGCAATAAAALGPKTVEARITAGGTVAGHLTGARALVESLLAEGVDCVFGIPGAQENELWDEMKSRGLPYLLVTHEFSAACMADGAGRSTGKPGVICVVPGPGLTNALTGIGEALLDSTPMVCVVGDVARGDKYKPFQVHELPQVGLVRQVTKGVFEVAHVEEIPGAVRSAFALALAGEPGPVAVVVPYNLLIEEHKFRGPGPIAREVPFDENAFNCALQLLSNRKLRVGVYAGLGCMDFADSLTKVAELLQAPVATSVSGKGAIDDCHPLAVGWGYGPQGTRTAEAAFQAVDLVLAIGVRYSEVSTGFYAIPKIAHVIHVDANPNNLGRIVKADVCVNADAGVFLEHLLAAADQVRRPCDGGLAERIRRWKCDDAKEHAKRYARCGADPMAFLLALRKATCPDALTFVDVSAAEHWAAEAYTVRQPRTYFNPTDNQAMGWSIPAALGGAAPPSRPSGRHRHRGWLLFDVRHGDFHRGSREPPGEVFHPGRPGLSLHASSAIGGVQADDGDGAGAAGLRGARQGIRRRLRGNWRRRRPVPRHQDRAGARRAGADARRHRLRQTADPLDRGGPQAIHG